jgi:hypothetical protein
MEKVIQFDSAVGISLDTGWTVLFSNPGKGDFSFLSYVHAGSGASPDSYSVGYELNHYLHIVKRLRMSGAMTLLPLHAFMAWIGTVDR